MPELTADELRCMREADQDLVVINVLAAEDHREQHIPSSVNVPLDREHFVEEVLALAGSKDAKVVVYCASSTCRVSPRAAKKLEQAGFRRIYNLAAGIQGWREAGLPVESELARP